jgi:hypothetical protein
MLNSLLGWDNSNWLSGMYNHSSRIRQILLLSSPLMEQVCQLCHACQKFSIAISCLCLVLRLLLSSETQEQIDKLSKRFIRFKQQFDRGIAVQSAAALEKVLKDMGAFLHPRLEPNH